jgi:hypothetical protein
MTSPTYRRRGWAGGGRCSSGARTGSYLVSHSRTAASAICVDVNRTLLRRLNASIRSMVLTRNRKLTCSVSADAGLRRAMGAEGTAESVAGIGFPACNLHVPAYPIQHRTGYVNRPDPGACRGGD